MSKTQSPVESKSSVTSDQKDVDDALEWSEKPEFIYGGPFIKSPEKNPFMDTATPRNLQLQGTFKQSFAYYSLKERLPVILTKVIDYLSRDADKIKSTHNATDQDTKQLIQYINKLKNDLITNKRYDLLTVDTPEAKRWNKWISETENSYYFTNTWVFTECYVYRRLREGCELSKNLQNFDPFDAQKAEQFKSSIEAMCVVTDRLVTMLPEGGKDKRKQDFMTLLKVCLWANKCDLSLSLGEQVSIKNTQPAVDDKNKLIELKPAPSGIFDPFQMIVDLKDKLLVDDTGKAADQVVAKAEAIRKAISGNTNLKIQCSCHRLATLANMPICKEKELPDPTASPTDSPAPAATPGEQDEEETKPPCPAKLTTPQNVFFDIVCDNSGYELFADLCFAHFLIAQKIVDKVRFHVKKIPWFVSDVTRADFRLVIEWCASSSFSKTVDPPTPPEPADGEPAPPRPEPQTVTSDSLREVGEQWGKLVEEGAFLVLDDDFWTSPHVYKDMKKYDPVMYRKLQFASAILFKGDLNYRKLLGEKNWNPTTGFEASLQGFMPAPLIAVRTVKADLISGLPKGVWEKLNASDPKWMEKGDYGVIQFCGKAEPLKVSERPCEDYGGECRGEVCADHQDY